jgi:hypothetical protein
VIARPPFLFALAFAVIVLIWGDHAPSFVMWIAVAMVVVVLLILAVAIFAFAERSDGRAE